ncbi:MULTISPECIES: extensin family protein [Bradyrhizobium]|jgi:hypothetical protein|nr:MULTISPECIES: extensin family protein [Bradyrhizobium]
MNCSAEKASRKWASGAFGRNQAAMVTAAAVLLLLGAQAGPVHAAKGFRPAPWGDLFGVGSPRREPRGERLRGSVRRAAVPLPRPRPDDAPAAETATRTGPAAAEPQAPQAGKPAEQAAPATAPSPPPAPQASACRQALTEAIAIAPSIPDIHGAGGCGGEDLVRLEAIVLPDQRRVAVKPAAILRCAMASELADWIRTDIAPLAVSLGSTISDLDNFDSFECRGRNRIVGARLSEHGRANALDVRALKLANGRSISLTDRTVPRAVRETVLHSVCARFSTVLGPSSDWYHEDHIHLDLMERRNNYRICQWDVLDPLPQIAPLLPAIRPDDAPPREVAAKSDGAKPDNAKPEAAAPAEAAKQDKAEPEPAKPATKKPATKKRR